MSRPEGLRPTVILSLFCEESLFRGSSNKILHFVQDDKKMMRLLRRLAPRKDGKIKKAGLKNAIPAYRASPNFVVTLLAKTKKNDHEIQAS